MQTASGGDPEACAEAVPEAFGASASTVSRRFIRARARQLEALQTRRLDALDLVALILDGTTFAEDAMWLALGITATGEKVVWGLVQRATENAGCTPPSCGARRAGAA